eukprot:297211-Amphidinium_carterae.1
MTPGAVCTSPRCDENAPHRGGVQKGSLQTRCLAKCTWVWYLHWGIDHCSTRVNKTFGTKGGFCKEALAARLSLSSCSLDVMDLMCRGQAGHMRNRAMLTAVAHVSGSGYSSYSIVRWPLGATHLGSLHVSAMSH